MKTLKKIVNSPWIGILLSATIMFAAGNEIIGEIEEEFELGAHHGIGFYGAVLFMKSLIELLESTVNIAENIEELKQ